MFSHPLEAKLLPCPFCESTRVEFYDSADEWSYTLSILCRECGAEPFIQHHDGIEAAPAGVHDALLGLWNRRPA